MTTFTSVSESRPLKLATYNVHNLGRADSPGPEAYRAKLGFLANVLHGIDADLVVVNEVREEDSFAELADACGIYPGRVLGGSVRMARELHTGILTRLEVIEQGEWHEFPVVEPGRAGVVTTLEFRRPVPWVKVRLGSSETLFAVGVHLKSRRPDVEAVPDGESGRRREVLGRAVSAAARVLEAGGLRCLLDSAIEEEKADHYGVLGDFNDPTDSIPVRLVCGPHGGTQNEDGLRLFAVAEKMEGDALFSYAGQGRKEMIDQILLSRGLFAALSRAGVETGLLEPGADLSVGSDHAPVWAEFRLEVKSETES